MSRTTVYVVNDSNKIVKLRELRNSWGSATVVWSVLFDKYITREHKYDDYLSKPERLWVLYDDPRLSDCERFALFMTFDRFIIEGDKFIEAADLLDLFVHNSNYDRNRVNHLPYIAQLLRDHAGKYKGMCFYMTSVADNPWFISSEDRPFDFSIDNHYWVFESMTEVKK